MNHSIAFVISRMNAYRFFAPVIDRAIQRGWHVECWHDVGNFNPDRSEDFPSIGSAPVYSSGQPLYREYKDIQTVYGWIRQHKVDAVIDVIPHDVKSYVDGSNQAFSAVICLNANTDWQAYLENSSCIDSVDIFALNTSYWLDQSLEMISSRNPNWWNEELKDLISSKTKFVGWPQLDQLPMISPEEVRREYAIPTGKPVVIYFNWIDYYLFNLRQKMFASIGPKHKLLTALRNFHEIFSYLKYLFEPDLEKIMKSIRNFCDYNDAFLVVKHRYRDKPFACEYKAADLVISDESYYPHAIFKVLSVASLSLGYFSFAVRESVACKVPYLSIDVCGLADLKSWNEKGESYYRKWSDSSGPFNYKDIVSVMKDVEFISKFEKMSLTDFRFEECVYKEYTRKYLSATDISSDELLETIESHLIRKTKK